MKYPINRTKCKIVLQLFLLNKITI